MTVSASVARSSGGKMIRASCEFVGMSSAASIDPRVELFVIAEIEPLVPSVVARYFGKFNPARQDKWIFGRRDTGFYLRKFAWTPIVRHRMVAGTASPDDPCLTDYWAQRRRRSRPCW